MSTRTLVRFAFLPVQLSNGQTIWLRDYVINQKLSDDLKQTGDVDHWDIPIWAHVWETVSVEQLKT